MGAWEDKTFTPSANQLLDPPKLNLNASSSESVSIRVNLWLGLLPLTGKRLKFIGSEVERVNRRYLFRLRDIWRQIFRGSAQCRHKAYPVSLRNDTSPAFLIYITPARKSAHRAGLGVSLRREEKKLHPLFDDPDLGDAPRILIIENTATEGAKVGKLWGHVIVLQTMLHKKQIT